MCLDQEITYLQQNGPFWSSQKVQQLIVIKIIVAKDLCLEKAVFPLFFGHFSNHFPHQVPKQAKHTQKILKLN